jgi:D-alanine-D-alanine ligase-like ATP-grasp enzyme
MLNILCVSRFFKGNDFLTSIHEEGHNVYLLTSTKLANEAWPFEVLTDKYFMPEDEKGNWNIDNLINGLAYTMKDLRFDILVSLDDFDVENTALLREYFRVGGMGETTARYFRDKLAMRIKAKESGIKVPEFSPLFHNEDINQFINNVPPPYMVKPRGQASATGISKVHSGEELWRIIDSLGADRHKYLVERFAPGDVFHVDALSFGGEVVFSKASRYLNTPFEVAHHGGIFRSQTIDLNSDDDKKLKEATAKLMTAFGMQYSASHTEFIKGQDGEIYFLETSCRVGGANLAEMVEASSGINLWREWARIEIAAKLGNKYKVPKVTKLHAGILVSLCKYEHPDLSGFNDFEIAWKMNKPYHVGIILASKDKAKVDQLLETYLHKIQSDFHASMPITERPTN